jgi:hypothetical protein
VNDRPEPQSGSGFSIQGKEARTLSFRGQRASLMLGALATSALAPTFSLLAPESSWSPALLALTLAAIAGFSYLGGLAVRASALLDAGFVAALVALGTLGPLPAASIWIGTEVAALALERVRVEAFLANVASYGWAVLAGALVLEALVSAPLESGSGAHAYAAVAVAGAVMLTVNFLVTRTLVAVVRDGGRLRAVMRAELVAHAPATLLITALGAATLFGYERVGLLALGLFALVVVAPQAVLPALLRPRPVAGLGHTEAVRLYADAIGRALELRRSERLVLRDAAAYLRQRQLRPRTGGLSDLSHGHRLKLVEAVLFHREHWDGRGGVPGAVGGEMIPLASRILAVSDAWAGLTAKGSPGLSHDQALNQLEARAGMHFDPAVVGAALRVVAEQEIGGVGAVAYEPGFRRLPVAGLARRLGIVPA